MFIAVPACPMGGAAVFHLYFGAIQPRFCLFCRVGGVWWGVFGAKFGVNWLGSLMGRAGTAIEMGFLSGLFRRWLGLRVGMGVLRGVHVGE